MKKNWINLAFCLAMGAAAPSFAQFAPATPTTAAPAAVAPQRQNAIAVELIQQKVVKDAQGKEKLVDADSVLPNDVVEYRAVYKNVSSAPVKQMAASLPLPEGLEYVPNSAKPAKGVQFAPESKAYGPEPLMRKLPDGRIEKLPYADYRHIRWVVEELKPGAEVAVSARAKVEAVIPISAAAAPKAAPAAK